MALSADPRRFRPALGGRFTYPPTPLPPLDPPIFDESFKRHPTRLLRPLKGTPRQFWNPVPKSTTPDARVLRAPALIFEITLGRCRLKEISRPRRGVPFKATTHRRVSFIAENAWLGIILDNFVPKAAGTSPHTWFRYHLQSFWDMGKRPHA